MRGRVRVVPARRAAHADARRQRWPSRTRRVPTGRAPSAASSRCARYADGVERFRNEFEPGTIDGIETGFITTPQYAADVSSSRRFACRARALIWSATDAPSRSTIRPACARLRGLRLRDDWGEFGGHGFTEYHATRSSQLRYTPPSMRLMAAVNEECTGRHIRGVDHVLDAERNAVQGCAATRDRARVPARARDLHQDAPTRAHRARVRQCARDTRRRAPRS